MAKKNSSNKNSNKRPGLSRAEKKKLLGMTRYQQFLRRLQGTSDLPHNASFQDIVAKYIDNEPKKSVVVKIHTNNDTMRFKNRRKALWVSESEKLASRLVGDSSRSVIEDLGIKMLEVPNKPELAHVFGQLVAARAVSMAREIVSVGRIGGGGGGIARMGAGNLINSIGSTGLEVEISPSGDVHAVVKPKSSATCRRRKSMPVQCPAEAEPSTPSVGTPPEESPVENREEEIKVGHKLVIKHPNGNTTIYIDKLIFDIKINTNDTMIVSKGSVNVELANHEVQLLSAIESKSPDEMKEDENEP